MKINSKSIMYLKGVGESRAKLFAQLGIADAEALLHFYPRTYLDWSKPLYIKQAEIGEVCCIRAEVASETREYKIRNNMSMYKLKVKDKLGMILNITFFNNIYAAQKMELDKEFLFMGKLVLREGMLEMLSPSFRNIDTAARLEPVYHLTKGLTSLLIQNTVRQALSLDEELYDFIPQGILTEQKLCSLRFALENIHFPKNEKSLSEAKRRLVFDELFVFMLGLALLKEQNRQTSAHVINADYTDKYLKLLPFRLTTAQRKCVAETVNDMKKKVPMRRLLQGDVGSGKTCVAAASMYTAAKNKIQSSLMVPTEILAEQHFKTLTALLCNSGVAIELLTGSTTAKEKRRIKESLANGMTDIAVGTHALISDDVTFKRLGLVITDEQHRFGVGQRAKLFSKGSNPHTLVMSATPIPRTLALIIYGDLDISVIDTLPPGRQPIETYRIDSTKRSRAFGFVKNLLAEGRQAYIICTLVEEGENERKAAVTYAQTLTENDFSGYSVGLLHGKMKPKEKEKVMKDFFEKRIDILVSTTVVEVGVDVPNAVVMLIEDAERFGLSQLHQLRGRVGRGKHKSYCIFVSDSRGMRAKERFKVMCSTTDGFKIADEDLKQRGPGDFFGNAQHGLPLFKIADFIENMEVLETARRCAQKLLINDPKLELAEHRELKQKLDSLFSDMQGKEN